MADLHSDVVRLETKIVALARVMPEAAYDWRPGEGVRSTAEVLIHVAADNYFAAANLGDVIAAETGIVGQSYLEMKAYEARTMTKAEVVVALEHSFGLLKQAMAETSDEKLAAPSDYFGNRTVLVRQAWLAATTHLHEHLGQMIAYARSNHVVPPWSR